MYALRQQVTRAVLCDSRPPCVTELLFDHELWLKPGHGFRKRAIALRRCSTWQRDSDWPTEDPHLARQPHFRGFWSVLRQLPNRTVWVHGDSIQMQLFSAALCSLLRDGKLRTPVYHHVRPRWVDALSRESGLNLFYTEAINGARLLGSGLGPFEPRGVELVLASVDVALLNFGLHYHEKRELQRVLGAAFALLDDWRGRAPAARRLALWREASAQHFAGGAYSKGAELPPPGTPCRCYPLSHPELLTAATPGHAAAAMRDEANLNVFAGLLEQQLAAQRRIPLVPFFNLTAPRHDMHRAHLCSYHDQRRVGSCCDCTHLCYTPVFWDAVFTGFAATVRRARAAREPPSSGSDRHTGRNPFEAVARSGRHQRGRRRGGGRGRGRGRALRRALESPASAAAAAAVGAAAGDARLNDAGRLSTTMTTAAGRSYRDLFKGWGVDVDAHRPIERARDGKS